MSAGEKASSSTRPAEIDSYQLSDRYRRQAGRVYLNGSQALVRLPMMQRQLDLAAGLNTAGFISGYTGSPLGGYDTALQQAGAELEEHHIHFQPGINEDLGATAVAGSQQIDIIAESKYDGVFGLWYGKGPGVDRSGDALKHGSYAGSSKHGGVLVLAGDDHGAKSSTTAHQSDHAFIHFGMPYLNPANVQEYLDFGLLGIALSRYSGCWVGMKCVTDTIESSASVDIDLEHFAICMPEDYTLPAAGLNVTGPLPAKLAEQRQYQQRHPAAQAFVRANHLDKCVIHGQLRHLGIVTTGKAHLDVMQALAELGLDEDACRELGLGVYKVAMPWPLEPEKITRFAEGYDELLVIEEKRPVIEQQLASLFVNKKNKPLLLGKLDETGRALISAEDELDPVSLALIIGKRLLRTQPSAKLKTRLERLASLSTELKLGPAHLARMPSFCAGCPHNTSTNVPEGSMALGGIGCHGMATFLPERRTPTLFQMGGEGAPWIGMSPFTEVQHIFQNLGDGTYYHSGLLAIRAAVAAGVNITYKILVNDAIAMTGGQAIAGKVRVDALTLQLYGEGVRRIAVVSNNLEQYSGKADFAPGVTLHHRDRLSQVQSELREQQGVSVLIYDQHCATELRRRRKRGKADDPDRRLFINQRVCEGCGDCSVQSNCIALEPEDTEYGRKRKINQSVCNKDFSCVKGYCPSFVSVYGGVLKKQGRQSAASGGIDIHARLAQLAEPKTTNTDEPVSVLITGIGGTGVVTLGALIGMAAFLEGKGCSVLDVAGLAQRNGPVTSHIRVANNPGSLHATRIVQVDLILGCDIVVAAGQEVLRKIVPNHSRAVINSHVAPTSEFASNPDLNLSAENMMQTIKDLAGDERVEFVDSSRLATALMGNEVAANMFLIGYAIQKGWMPIGLAAIERAIELNGVAVEMNKLSLAWGRLAAVELPSVEKAALPGSSHTQTQQEMTLDTVVKKSMNELSAYQNTDYAERYRRLVDKVSQKEQTLFTHSDELAWAVAKYYFKLLAYKDEYEVARLYTEPAFLDSLNTTFEQGYKLAFHLAPPLLQRRDPDTGRYPKRTFGSWILPVFKVLAKLKFLRGTVFDIFSYSAHRRTERQLISDYEQCIETLLAGLKAENHALAIEIASLPESIRGYDSVKEKNIEDSRKRLKELLTQFHSDIAVGEEA